MQQPFVNAAPCLNYPPLFARPHSSPVLALVFVPLDPENLPDVGNPYRFRRSICSGISLRSFCLADASLPTSDRCSGRITQYAVDSYALETVRSAAVEEQDCRKPMQKNFAKCEPAHMTGPRFQPNYRAWTDGPSIWECRYLLTRQSQSMF